jgi:hypothetical protein
LKINNRQDLQSQRPLKHEEEAQLLNKLLDFAKGVKEWITADDATISSKLKDGEDIVRTFENLSV